MAHLRTTLSVLSFLGINMKKLILIAVLSFVSGYAVAQSTATPIVMGYNTNIGCLGSINACWKPYTIANPFPIISN